MRRHANPHINCRLVAEKEGLLRREVAAESGRGGWTRDMRHPVTFEINSGIPAFCPEARFLCAQFLPSLRAGLHLRPRLFPPRPGLFLPARSLTQARPNHQAALVPLFFPRYIANGFFHDISPAGQSALQVKVTRKWYSWYTRAYAGRPC